MSTASSHPSADPSGMALSFGPDDRVGLGERFRARLTRLTSWEYWPASIVYAPLAPYLLALALRHRSLTAFTAANPGIPDGGFVGESKHALMRHVPADLSVAGERIHAADPAERRARIIHHVRTSGWAWPIIIKPDVGERGAGVRLARSPDDLRRILDADDDRPLLIQAYHPGPHECGVFYVRHPDEPSGRIFSITDKVFPVIVGDARSTLRRLIYRHPRFAAQASTFLARLGDGAARVPAMGEHVRLAIAGNHCQGTMFLDGSHLRSPGLEHAIDRAARAIPGFYFGRFDVRYRSADELRDGRGLGIVEVNGVLSESTNIYDPSMPLTRAYATLARQWSHAFAIGAANIRRGAHASSWRRLLALSRSHSRRDGSRLAD